MLYVVNPKKKKKKKKKLLKLLELRSEFSKTIE